MSQAHQVQELQTIVRCPQCGTRRWLSTMRVFDGRELSTVQCSGCNVTAFVLTNVGERDRRRRNGVQGRDRTAVTEVAAPGLAIRPPGQRESAGFLSAP